jgi:hypothetical protein
VLKPNREVTIQIGDMAKDRANYCSTRAAQCREQAKAEPSRWMAIVIRPLMKSIEENDPRARPKVTVEFA